AQPAMCHRPGAEERSPRSRRPGRRHRRRPQRRRLSSRLQRARRLRLRRGALLMARGGGGNDRERRRAPKDTARRGKKKVCIFCKEHIEWVDYKDVNLLRRFMSDRGKIRARRVSGNCAQHQRDVAVAIKTARALVLLPYTQRTVTERGPGRGPRPDRGDRPPRGADM